MIFIYIEKMLKLILIISATLISSNVLCQNSDSVKCWNDQDKLQWSDFRGKKPENEDSFLRARTAIRIIPISSIKKDVLDYQVQVVVRKYHSWKTDTSKHLLIHEQLHFDIGELTARKLRKAIHLINASTPAPTERDFDEVILKLYRESANMQEEYDKQTYHGIITDSQIEWQKKIYLELNKLKNYASTIADCQ